MTTLCTGLQQRGFCGVDHCSSSHDINLFCFDCNVVAIDADGHISTVKHQRTLAFKRLDPVCPLCNVIVGPAFWGSHSQGKRHIKNWNEKQRPDITGPIMQRIRPEGKAASCDICCRDFVNKAGLKQHNGSPPHKKQLQQIKIGKVLRAALQNSNQVTVSPSDAVDFGEIEAQSLGTEPERSILLTIKTNSRHIRLQSMRILGTGVGANPFNLHMPTPNPPVNLVPRTALEVLISLKPGSLRGRFTSRLELIFQDNVTMKPFVISRTLQAGVGVPIELQLSPYVRKERRVAPVVKNLVRNTGLQYFNSIHHRIPLAEYPFDESFMAITGSRGDRVRALRSRLPFVLHGSTYRQHWSALLNAEEAQMRKDLEAYDLYETHLEGGKHGNYHLDVPGLAEKRPSVLVHDTIHLRLCSDPDRWYEGHVTEVEDQTVSIRFPEKFRYHQDEPCDVRFTVGRLLFRRMHQAVQSSFAPDRVLFPDSEHAQNLIAPAAERFQTLQVFDDRIASNEPQLRAVTAIVDRPSGSLPFIVFGPPGTGKTVTVVEAIRQILAEHPNAHVLACAPSNSAADIIAERLIDLTPAQMFRMVAPSRNPKLVPATLDAFVCTTGEGKERRFTTPGLDVVQRYRVIVSTCMSAWMLHGMGVPAGHFSHIFIDEAGQCMEPELAVAFKTLADDRTNLVLSGDPKQLGPIVRSKIAGQLGLDASFLDRLSAREAYDEDSGADITITKLLKNFRSHEAILRFSNETFYRNQLEVHGSPDVINSMLGSPELANPEFPVVFYGIEGRDGREHGSPSYFNTDELSLVTEIIDNLKADTDRPLQDKDIGVITPYNAQGSKLRRQLKDASYPGIKVGSVEEFQGQERKVILISTVRSDPELVGHDLRHVLGFLVNPRRLNVAITRAQALLIIVGNPNVLGLDRLWRKFMKYIYLNGGWKGTQPTWDVNEVDVDDGLQEAGGPHGTAKDEMDSLARQIKQFMVSEAVPNVELDGDDYEEELVEALVETVNVENE